MKSLHFSPSPLLIIFASLAMVFVVSGSSHLGSTTVMAGGEEWRPINPADLALKGPLVEAGADAEAIFWDIRVDDAGHDDLVLSHYIRIKIFTDRGREQQAKIDIPYGDRTKIKDVAARTIKADGSILELAKEDIIERTIVKVGKRKVKTKSFAFPGIEPGAIIEYKWKEVISNGTANYLSLDFQRDIPIEETTYHIKPMVAFDVRPFNMAKPEFVKEKNGFFSTTVRDMPAFHEEPYMPPEKNVRSWAMFSYRNIFSLLLGYNLMASQLYVSFEPYLKVDDEIKRKSAEITAGAATPDEKIAKIFAFCRAEIKNTSDRASGFTADEIEKMKDNKKPADTLKHGVGSWMDIDLLFAALARASGLDARVALLPDRGKRLFDPGVVMPGALRPSTIAVRTGETWKFYDPGFHYIPPDMLRWQEEAVDALITSEMSPTWVKTPLSPPAKSKETRVATLRLDEDGTLEGDISIQVTGHSAVEQKDEIDEDSANQREETLKADVKSRLSTAELTNISIENVTDSVKPLVYKYHVRVPGYAQRTGRRIFLQPAYFEKGIPALFAASTRKYPIYFHYPWSEDDNVEITLPKGYVLDNADAPQPILAGGVSRYEVKIQVATDYSTLIYTRKFFFGGENQIFFLPTVYETLKKLFDEMNKADNHTITLKQSGPN